VTSRAVLATAVLSLVAALPALAARPTTEHGDELVVAVSLPRAVFQVGAVRGSEVVFARGLEIDVARSVARRLGLRPRFVQVSDPRRLVAPGKKWWHIALAQLEPTPERRRAVDFSTPYARADQVVLLSRGVERPRSLAGLRRLQLCGERRSRAIDLIASRIRPSLRPLTAPDVEGLLRRVQTGVCEAAVADVARIGPALSGKSKRFGGIAGRIETGAYAVALERGSALTPAVDRALRRLSANGSLRRLAKSWLGVDLSRLRLLR
jgi:polar amino acid transport system substrate-binding protein